MTKNHKYTHPGHEPHARNGILKWVILASILLVFLAILNYQRQWPVAGCRHYKVPSDHNYPVPNVSAPNGMEQYNCRGGKTYFEARADGRYY